MQAVEEVLEEILTEPTARLVLLNKADLLTDEVAAHALRLRHRDAEIISAIDPTDIDRLRDRLVQEVKGAEYRIRMSFPTSRLAEAYEILKRGRTWTENYSDGTVYGEYSLSRPDIERLRGNGFKVRVLSP
jgi:50S ribosomal subunit-associated GTPase HflX